MERQVIIFGWLVCSIYISLKEKTQRNSSKTSADKSLHSEETEMIKIKKSKNQIFQAIGIPVGCWRSKKISSLLFPCTGAGLASETV